MYAPVSSHSDRTRRPTHRERWPLRHRKEGRDRVAIDKSKHRVLGALISLLAWRLPRRWVATGGGVAADPDAPARRSGAIVVIASNSRHCALHVDTSSPRHETGWSTHRRGPCPRQRRT